MRKDCMVALGAIGQKFKKQNIHYLTTHRFIMVTSAIYNINATLPL